MVFVKCDKCNGNGCFMNENNYCQCDKCYGFGTVIVKEDDNMTKERAEKIIDKKIDRVVNEYRYNDEVYDDEYDEYNYPDYVPEGRSSNYRLKYEYND